MKHFSLCSPDLSGTLEFAEPVFFDMKTGKEKFLNRQEHGTLTIEKFYNLKYFLPAKETSEILSLEPDYDLKMTI